MQTAYSGLCCFSLGLGNARLLGRRSRHVAHPRIHAAYDLQLRRHHHGPRAPPADRERRHQPHPVLLGQHAHRPDLHRVPHPRQAGQGRSGGHHLSRRPQRRPAMEHQEPDRRQDARRDQVFYQRHHLGRRLRGHRQRGRNEDQPDRLRAGDERVGRAVRQCGNPSSGGQHQPRGEDCRSGEEAATR